DGEPETRLVQECIQPGKSQAILYMASGQVVSVDKDAQELKEADGTCINVDSVAGMTYNVAAGESSSEVLYNRVVVPKGGEFKLTLSDGTKVWLNSFSELRYPVNFTGKKREVILAGEAYFDVVGDPEHPFVVKVNDLDISVLGTQFNVNAYTAGIVKTVLVEGRVNLRGRMGEIDLHPRQMGEYRETDGNLHMTDVDVLPHVAWKDGNFIFRSESLEDIMDKLSIWYNLDVFYTNDELRGIRLSGNLFRYGDVNQLFTLFEKISDARFQVEGKSVVISCK
ncbi:MAG: FecR family protein, partial [Butyricimonas faecihominis]